MDLFEVKIAPLDAPSQKKTSKIIFVIYVKLPPNLIIFGTKVANSLVLYEVHSFSNEIYCLWYCVNQL